MRASVMHERKKPEFAVILCFDVAVSKEAQQMANEMDVKIFTADIIYHLFDQFTAYMAQVDSEQCSLGSFLGELCNTEAYFVLFKFPG